MHEYLSPCLWEYHSRSPCIYVGYPLPGFGRVIFTPCRDVWQTQRKLKRKLRPMHWVATLIKLLGIACALR